MLMTYSTKVLVKWFWAQDFRNYSHVADWSGKTQEISLVKYLPSLVEQIGKVSADEEAS